MHTHQFLVGTRSVLVPSVRRMFNIVPEFAPGPRRPAWGDVFECVNKESESPFCVEKTPKFMQNYEPMSKADRTEKYKGSFSATCLNSSLKIAWTFTRLRGICHFFWKCYSWETKFCPLKEWRNHLLEREQKGVDWKSLATASRPTPPTTIWKSNQGATSEAHTISIFHIVELQSNNFEDGWRTHKLSFVAPTSIQLLVSVVLSRLSLIDFRQFKVVWIGWEMFDWDSYSLFITLAVVKALIKLIKNECYLCL